MSQSTKRRLFRLVIDVLLIGVFAVIGWLCIGLNFNFSGQSPLAQLKAAQATWQKQALSSYRMKLGFGSFGYLGAFTVTVIDNHITKMVDVINNPGSEISLSPTTKPNWFNGFTGFLPDRLDQYTVDQLFTFAAQKLVAEPTLPTVSWCSTSFDKPHYEAHFDNNTGYISALIYTSRLEWQFGGGLLCGVCSDCTAALSVSDLQPVE